LMLIFFSLPRSGIDWEKVSLWPRSNACVYMCSGLPGTSVHARSGTTSARMCQHHAYVHSTSQQVACNHSTAQHVGRCRRLGLSHLSWVGALVLVHIAVISGALVPLQGEGHEPVCMYDTCHGGQTSGVMLGGWAVTWALAVAGREGGRLLMLHE
jgi:hypothetical protein